MSNARVKFLIKHGGDAYDIVSDKLFGLPDYPAMLATPTGGGLMGSLC